MQDTSNGAMINLDSFMPPTPQGATPSEFQRAMERAGEKAIPNPEHRGPTFFVGEILDIKGGRFQITRIEPGHMRLKGLRKA